MTLNESGHFIPIEKIPVITDRDTIVTAFRQLNEAKIGGLMVLKRLNAQQDINSFDKAIFLRSLPLEKYDSIGWYVTGDWMIKVYRLLSESLTDPIRGERLSMSALVGDSRFDETTRETRALSTSPGIDEIREEIIRIQGVVPNDHSSDDLQNRADAVFLVRDSSGQPLGWFLNHENVVATIQTPPPVFKCENGHENPDPDNGRCYECPAKIIC